MSATTQARSDAKLTEGPAENFDVAVIGAGQAGLAMGYFLAQQRRRFVILDRADSIGATWRSRWDSLVLFTARRYDNLPGLAFPGDPEGYPTRDEVAGYLEHYARSFELPIELTSEVRRLTKNRDTRDTFVLELDNRTLEASQVVIATGPFQTPGTPEFATKLAPEVFQTHSAGYRNPADLPPGTVLVVGGGNTGYQIAGELSATHRVYLAVGGRQTPLPQKLLGRDLFWWLVATRLLKLSVESRLGRKLRTRDTLIGSSARTLKRHGVLMKPRAAGASGRAVTFADGSELEVDAVVWATGFGLSHAWIDLPVTDINGRVLHRRGITDTPGLYFLGLTWQHTRGSALLGWVKDDAEFIATAIDAAAPARVAAAARALHPTAEIERD